MKKFILTSIISLLVGFLLGGLLFYSCNKKESQIEYIKEIKTDTITTIRYLDKHHYDTIIINDTVWIKDEPQHYTDSTENFKLDINAVKLYDYRLDIYKSDTIYQPVEIKPLNQKKCKQFIGIGVGVNYGLCINPYNMQASFQPNISLGIVYGFGYTW